MGSVSSRGFRRMPDDIASNWVTRADQPRNSSNDSVDRVGGDTRRTLAPSSGAHKPAERRLLTNVSTIDAGNFLGPPIGWARAATRASAPPTPFAEG